MRKLILALVTTVSITTSCQTVERPPAAPIEHPAIAKAANDLSTAKSLGAEWLVSDRSTNYTKVGLTALLSLAREKMDKNEISEALRLAEKVSSLSLLAIQQANENQYARPDYDNFDG